jgi:predicted CXXCH cytochrome family protein
LSAKRLWPAIAVVGLSLAVGTAWWYRLPRHPASAPLVQGDPCLNFPTPYLNVRPDVRYVGDSACAGCHAGHAKTFAQHPMGQSLTVASERAALENLTAAANNPFERFGNQFSVERRENRLFHKETDLSAPEGGHFTQEVEISYVLGSGTHGRSYLIDRNGYLFQSSISWYENKPGWDLSPGCAADTHFTRAVPDGCVFCHSNGAEPVEHSANHFRPPVFRGLAIGCERCHGPGELHARLREQKQPVAEFDYTIVIPRHLEPALRDAVCEQCHLIGMYRILRRGRQFFDFRPGLPLHLFLSIYTRPAGVDEDKKVTGHVGQLRRSVCFQKSAGALGCISCHDPHEKPAPAQTAAYFRSRCLGCHTETSCALEPPVRRQQAADDSCVACHMPRNDSLTPAHSVLTDHRILRRPDVLVAPPMTMSGPLLVHFHRDLAGCDSDQGRDTALAMIESARGFKEDPERTEINRLRCSQAALPLLEEALGRVPEDPPAWEAKGHALRYLGRLPQALAAFDEALAQAPARESALAGAAVVAESLGRGEAARAYYRRLVEVDPVAWENRYQLGRLLADARDWPGATAECAAALDLYPFSAEVRLLRIRCRLATGDRAGAEADFNHLLQIATDPEALRRWFAAQQR